jgi:hypothetical protein
MILAVDHKTGVVVAWFALNKMITKILMLEIRATDRDGEKKASFHVLGLKKKLFAVDMKFKFN